MAIAFRAAASNSSLSATSLSINKPTGTVDGDVMIAVVTVRTGNSVDNAISAPGGWTLVDGTYDAGSPGVRTNVYWKLAASEGASYSFTFASSNEPCGSILSYSGVHTTSPIHLSSAAVQGTGSATRTTPSINITAPNCWALSYFADRSGSTWTGPDTERSEVKVPATSSSQVVCDSAATVAAGSTSRSATASASTSVAEAGIIALAPASLAFSGTATVVGAGTITATGAKATSGTATIGAGGTVTATGSKATSGTASLAGALTLTVTGTKHTGIGVPPRPRTRWQLVAGPASGGHELALTEAHARRYTARLKDNADLQFSIDGLHPQASALDELRTDVHLLFTGTGGTTRILDRCRVGPTQDTLDEDSHTVSVTCLDYKAVLARRRLYAFMIDHLSYTGIDQAEIAWDLITATQEADGGALGIAKSWTGTTPTGILRDRTYAAGDSIGERIQELSEVIDGFDWDVTPSSASGLHLNLWYPQRGSDRGVVLLRGGLVAKATREVSPSDYANALRYTGSEDPATTPVELSATALGDPTMPEGRWDAVHGDTGLTTDQALHDRAVWQLQQSQVIRPVYTVELAAGAWEGPDHIWLGDTVRLVIPSGRLQVDMMLRVYEIELALDGNNSETVKVTVGGPKPDFRRWPSATEKRLTNLERR